MVAQDARVAVSCTPAVREAPPDVNKCKDKFWVLMLKLSAETASSLAEADAEAQRKILADLWGSDAAKEAMEEAASETTGLLESAKAEAASKM